MQIHELPAQTTAADADVVAVDNGTTTQKMTVANIGKKITEDAAPAFTSGDSSEAASWTNVDAVTSGLSLKNILNRITTMMKNVRYLYSLLGTTDITGSGKNTVSGAIGGTSISDIGDGTVTGAISKLNTDLSLTSLSLTYKSNSLVDSTGFNRLAACKRSNMLCLHGNLYINFTGNTSSFVEIGRISNWTAAYDILQDVPAQDNGAKVALVQISTAGVISVFTATGTAGGFFRFNVAIPCA